ncbi:hypothetical protein AB0C34_30980 [Nocardia sp. NPDC049220]|uniref:helix-turn-helix transcriptional regulator n=1 Tax=Nocardia sp. NPDC049220 TaxID=3155273 RepID=UPI0033EAACAC
MTTVLNLYYTRDADPGKPRQEASSMPRDSSRTRPVEDIALAAQAAQLRQARTEGRTPPAGCLLGLPELPGGDVWVDIAGAEAITGIPSRTITGWLARGGPKKAPFPAPHRILYRLYWPLSALEEWTGDYSG